MPTVTEVCRMFHISRHTLQEWCRKVGVAPEQNKFDGRFWELTDDQVEQIRAFQAKRPQAQQTSPLRYSYTPRSIVPRTTLERSSVTDILSAPVSPPGDDPDVSDRPPAYSFSTYKPVSGRRRVAGRPQKKSPKSQLPEGWVELPDGWMAVSTFAETHGKLDKRSLERQAYEGRIRFPMPEYPPEDHPWGRYNEPKNKWYPITAAVYRDDQLPEVIRCCQEMWPEQYHHCNDIRCPCEKSAAS